MSGVAQRPVSSWGALSRQAHDWQPLHERHGVAARLAARPGGIAFGCGRSYGDQALNDGGILWATRGLDRFIECDAASGVLECEAGVTLGEIVQLALPQGWFLPVLPGTREVSVGGAIANDVHGKNHHQRGSFGEHVLDLALARSDGRLIRCGRGRDEDWLRATIGGMGLTGVIVSARLQLMRVPGPCIESRVQPFATLAEFLHLSDESEETEGREYSVAWIDCLATRGERLRGLFMRGRHVAAASATTRARALTPPRALRVPFTPPVSLIGTASLKFFNRLYHARGRGRAGQLQIEPWWAFFHPLDGLLDWNRLYGRRGLYQYQCVVPRAAQAAATAELLRLIAASGEGSFLGVLKCFGERPSRGLLGFPMPGLTLALDFANRGEKTLALFAQLDRVVAEAGGRLYPAKDARMPRTLFEDGYPRLAEFARYRDPGLSSAMSRRLFGH